MKRIPILLFILIFCLSGVSAGSIWTRADGEYFNRVVWHGTIEWTDGMGHTREGMAYVGVFGATYGLPSPSVALRLYPDRENHLRGNDYRDPTDGAYPELPIISETCGAEKSIDNRVSDDKIYLSGQDSIDFVRTLYDGHDLKLSIGVKDSTFYLNIPASNFRELFDAYLERKEFLTIGEWNIDKAETGTGTYTSITRYTNEDDGRALYFELCGDPQNGNSVQTVKLQMYVEDGDGTLAYPLNDTDKYIVTYEPMREWVIKETLFGTCYIFPETREALIDALGNFPFVTLKAVDRETGIEYTVDFDSEEFGRYLSYPYGFDY